MPLCHEALIGHSKTRAGPEFKNEGTQSDSFWKVAQRWIGGGICRQPMHPAYFISHPQDFVSVLQESPLLCWALSIQQRPLQYSVEVEFQSKRGGVGFLDCQALNIFTDCGLFYTADLSKPGEAVFGTWVWLDDLGSLCPLLAPVGF